MTLDARALVTIVRKGPGFELIVAAIARDENPRVCATALTEASILLSADGDGLGEITVGILVDQLELTVMPFTRNDWRAAAREHERQVKAAATPRPSLGHCLSAAIAANTGAPLIDV